jgi:hypothetical protein
MKTFKIANPSRHAICIIRIKMCLCLQINVCCSFSVENEIRNNYMKTIKNKYPLHHTPPIKNIHAHR